MSDIGIITGAAGGIGRATAERFARDGWDLALVDVADSVKQVGAEVAKASGRKVIGVSTDITKEAGLPPIDTTIKKLGGKLKFLGLIAGVLQKVGPIEHLDLHEWDRALNINVRGNVILMKHFIPALRAANGGSIVTVSSWYGRSGHGLFSAYCASKAALISLTHVGYGNANAEWFPPSTLPTNYDDFRRVRKRQFGCDDQLLTEAMASRGSQFATIDIAEKDFLTAGDNDASKLFDASLYVARNGAADPDRWLNAVAYHARPVRKGAFFTDFAAYDPSPLETWIWKRPRPQVGRGYHNALA